MKKIKMFVFIILLSFGCYESSVAQTYGDSNNAQGKGTIIIISEESKPNSNIIDTIYNNMLPKTNELKNVYYLFAGVFLLLICLYMIKKSYLNKKEKFK